MTSPYKRILSKRGAIYRSGLETSIAKSLVNRKVPFEYETETFTYTLTRTYTPDFILPNGIHVEAKGFLTPDDRRKMKAIRSQHPELDIRFVFQRASNKLSAKSRTTYGTWATSAGFKWAEGTIPDRWIKEKAKNNG